MSENIPKSRAPLFLTLIAAGVFLVGAALMPLLIRGQETALNGSGLIRPPLEMDQAAPQLALTDLQGNPVSLDTTRGKVVLVNNWATWCPPCKAEMPELQAYYKAHNRQGFVVIAIESGEPASEVADFVQLLGLTFPVWLDPKGAALDSFKNSDLPSSYVIDRQGSLRMSWTGSINQATLEKYVTPLVEK
jgi:cytochrome c biogenesis protein CcmG, thiol:disulfide interchange protein DsbE